MLLAFLSFAAPLCAETAPPNVVLLTLDGVAAPSFPRFWAKRVGEGALMEDLALSNLVVLSLPAYQSMMIGGWTLCWSNSCGRVGRRTLMERLRNELGLTKSEVALVGSWPVAALAAESREGSVTIDVSSATRRDAETWPRALAALERRPRFLWIALNDADEAGHRGDYPGHLAALRRYDGWLEELISRLDAMGAYGAATTLIVTTDHGRGADADWRSHGGRRAAARAWLYARGRGIRGGARFDRSAGGSHAGIRATTERLMGLMPAGAVLPVLESGPASP